VEALEHEADVAAAELGERALARPVEAHRGHGELAVLGPVERPEQVPGLRP